jgi:hypothetical protein
MEFLFRFLLLLECNFCSMSRAAQDASAPVGGMAPRDDRRGLRNGADGG